MLKNDNLINVNKKVTTYIDNLFSGVGASQQLFDLKEELVTNLKEKIADIKSRGLDDEKAFKEAVISMGDLCAWWMICARSVRIRQNRGCIHQ